MYTDKMTDVSISLGASVSEKYREMFPEYNPVFVKMYTVAGTCTYQ